MQTTTKKVKEGTKGQKQIVTENRETLKFYRNWILASFAIYIIGMMFSQFKTSDIVFTVFSAIIYAACYQFMVFMSKPTYSESGQLIDSGADLCINGGMAEHCKDVILLTCICQVLSLYSNYFWLLWLAIPAGVAWLLWKNVLSPYIFQEEEVGDPERVEKKQKKLERRMKRQMNH